MVPEQNKAAFRRLVEEVYTRGNLHVADELVSEDAVEHDPIPGQPSGAEGFKYAARMVRAAFPDVHITIEDLIAEGDKVAGRLTTTGTHTGEFLGTPPTGNKIAITEMHIARFRDGKRVQHWEAVDKLTLWSQPGVLSQPKMSS